PIKQTSPRELVIVSSTQPIGCFRSRVASSLFLRDRPYLANLARDSSQDIFDLLALRFVAQTDAASKRPTMNPRLIGQAINCLAWAVALASGSFVTQNISAQQLIPGAIASPAPPQVTGTAEVERVIVTGSNIPTAEEVGPNPVDTYRSEDIQKLGVHNSTDLLTKLPQEMGSTVNQNIANGGDGSVIPNLRGLLPKETLVLIDGKRAAIIGSGGAGSSGPGTAGVDINLIPFPMIDH